MHKKLTVHEEYMSGTLPLALVRSGDGFEIKTIEVGRPGEIRLLPGKARR